VAINRCKFDADWESGRKQLIVATSDAGIEKRGGGFNYAAPLGSQHPTGLACQKQ
jgi:hypothetical protein